MATQDMLEFAIVLSQDIKIKHAPRHLADFAAKLIRAAGSLHRRYEASGSYAWATGEAYEKATDRKERAVIELCKPFGIGVDFQRDPRGASVKLKLPSGRTNDWGREGYCVPTKGGRSNVL